MEPFSNQDVATEVLSRLPAKSLLTFKCMSKRWNEFISDPSFLRFHGQKFNTISGLFVQEGSSTKAMDFELINYIPVDKELCRVQDTVLDFLPEKVVLLASCSGLVCCRSFIHEPVGKHKIFAYDRTPNRNKNTHRKELVIYICNPATRQWIALRPHKCHVGEAFGLAFYPYGSSSASGPNFKLVGILQSKIDPYSYSFVIYSSETETWKTSQEVCKFNSKFYPSKEIFVNRRFHWLTMNHHIITFDAEQELAQVIKLPGVTMSNNCRWGLCLGESEGYLHYVVSSQFELKVWMLKDYDKPEWLLKLCLPLLEFCMENPNIFPQHSVESYYSVPLPDNCGNIIVNPLAFYDEVLYFWASKDICSYNFKSKILVNHYPLNLKQLGGQFRDLPTVIPYSASLTSLCNFKGVCVKQNGYRGRNSRRRTPKKPKMFRR